jgi:site-specific recombinase XerD
MLKNHTTDFLTYCKLADFSAKSIESLGISLREFTAYIATKKVNSMKDITYGHLYDFVTDFKAPSIHKKKARVWCLHQFFHFLTVSGHIEENIAFGLPYPKIEKKPYPCLGLRISELTKLQIKSFEPEHVPGNRIGLLRVRGKNKKQRALFVVNTPLYDEFCSYLKDPQSPKDKDKPLFQVNQDKAISNNRVQKLMQEFRRSLLHIFSAILLRSAQCSLSKFMRRFLTGYAITYNRRHHRHGHLFLSEA